MPSLSKISGDAIDSLAERWGVRRLYTFPKGISQWVNVVALLGFELAYFGAAVQYFGHYATGTNATTE